jgi:hypothetical protein
MKSGANTNKSEGDVTTAIQTHARHVNELPLVLALEGVKTEDVSLTFFYIIKRQNPGIHF